MIEKDATIAYETLLSMGVMKRANLISAGLTDYRIRKLVEKGYLRKIAQATYEADSTNFAKYTEQLCIKGDITKYRLALAFTEKNSPREDEINFRIFMSKATLGLYDEALDFLLTVPAYEKSPQTADVNFFLYMLSFLSKVPDICFEKIKNTNKESVFTTEAPERYTDTSATNAVRSLALRQDFTGAAIKLKELQALKGKLTEQDELTMALLTAASEANDKKFAQMRSFALERQIEELITLFEKEEKIHNFPSKYRAMFAIAKDIIDMRTTGTHREKSPVNSNSVLEYIFSGNYTRALDIYEKNAQNGELTKADKAIVSLLKQTLDFDKNGEETAPNEKLFAHPNTSTPQSVKQKDPLVSILIALISGNMNRAFIVLDGYLSQNSLTAYTYYIKDLIEISIAEKDSAFLHPMEVISKLKLGIFNMDVARYVDAVYYYLARNDMRMVTLYLRLIRDIVANGHSDISPEQMKPILASLETKMQKKMAQQPKRKPFKPKK